jgi:malate permease and related proteins
MMTFPPFIAILVAFATNHLGRPESFTQVVGALADTLTPIALAAVGFALWLDHVAGRLAALGVGLGFRRIVGAARHPTDVSHAS